jgi:hypothetical protein
MRNRVSTLAVAALLAMSIAPFANVASAMPVADALAIKNAAPTNIETVQWRGRGYGRGYYGRGWYGPGWGVGAGLVGGAIIGGMLAAPYYYRSNMRKAGCSKSLRTTAKTNGNTISFAT